MARRKTRKRPGRHREIPPQPGRYRRSRFPCRLCRCRECRSGQVGRQITAPGSMERRDPLQLSVPPGMRAAGSRSDATVGSTGCPEATRRCWRATTWRALASADAELPARADGAVALPRAAARARARAGVVTLGEGWTPLLPLRQRLGRRHGLCQHLLVKDERPAHAPSRRAARPSGCPGPRSWASPTPCPPTATPARRGPPTRARAGMTRAVVMPEDAPGDHPGRVPAAGAARAPGRRPDQRRRR